MSKEEAKKGWIWIVILFVLFIVCIGVGIVLKSYIPTPFEHKREIKVDTLKAEVNEIHELATLQYDYRETVKQEKKGILSKMFIATFDGIIKAGIDLDDVKYDVQNPEQNSEDPPVVKVTVPDAEILSHEDFNPKTLYEEGYGSKGIGNERNEKIKEVKKNKQKEFIKAGHLKEAKLQAEESIENLIHSVYGEDVVVKFADAE